MSESEKTTPQPAVQPDNSSVICPSCCHQFRAIPQDVQRLMLDAGFEPPFTQPINEPPQAGITELLARLEAAEADAARYRWLRASENDSAVVVAWVDMLGYYVPWESPEDVDVKVDELRARAKK